VGFGDTVVHLPRYLEAMEVAGFREWSLPDSGLARLSRQVPNRKWYATAKGATGASSELLLLHRPQ
jgi:hypothetical protein